MENKLISLAIPTFSRPEILRENILLMLPEIKEFLVPIYISDDSLDDTTKIMIDDLREEYENIYFYNNAKSLGHDRNVFHTLKLPNTKYVWLLGDSLALKRGAIKEALSIINEKKPQVIGVNAKNRDLDIANHFFDDPNLVLEKFGWHLTLTGATIYSEDVISNISEIEKQKNRNFPHIALIFNHLLSNCSFYWINNKWLFANKKKSSYWLKDLFKVFICDWSSVIRSLPNLYNTETKEKVILQHSKKLRLFQLRSLIYARYLNAYNIFLFKKYKKALVEHSGLGLFPLFIISLLPRALIKTIMLIRNYFQD